MRLRVLIDQANALAALDTRINTPARLDKHSLGVLQKIRQEYREKFLREFPGCHITFTPKNVSLQLPDGYPDRKIPITEPMPRQIATAVSLHGNGLII